MLTSPTQTIWSRVVRSHHDRARHNARIAARALVERRLEREDADRHLGESAHERYEPSREAG